mmetsp:Transcript_4832/g.13894  ORF Transcript_4832/g.13894 Transcript_4832/m.13894 type:complete len:392 (-) Transcript_4832:689-1864(-)|eukprot:CAMPEP_0206141152 /NCGR_PEP_ID=MMETSP1473-20131121/11935_1 /ASSEMBLY_ACC=CAM_ASM_001109 /TAXON_ID=1461547 /ORGANISM="Stichococcus sp, Strain RCC1054" /LENGTH=391 /DNA_ID=CAMNT_0053535589 /DNA_START=476 /DNA_END=1651 /DNA_ORIENTATION=+
MVKKKGAREMNPADAERKKMRQKEILRNKRERQFLRDASKKRSDPAAIRAELQEVIDLQEDGNNHLTIKLKKKALQGALDASVRKRREDAARAEMGAAGSATPMLNAHGHGAAVYRPEDSVYYHPQLNPEGKPPPGKPQRYRSVPQLEAAPRAPGSMQPPKAPPLPKGPAPSQPPLPSGPPPTSASSAPPLFPPGAILPPPDGPPPSRPLLPPPDGPPPGFSGQLPPPAFPPPGMLPPPAFPPPGMLPPPAFPPPAMMVPPGRGVVAAAAADYTAAARDPSAVKAPTISGLSTVAPRVRAERDRNLTSMVPASVRIQREVAKRTVGAGDLLPARNAAPTMAPGYGLAPAAAQPRNAPVPAAKAPAEKQPPAEDSKFSAFMADMAALGAIPT